MSAYGERLDLPAKGQGAVTCANTGDRYVLDGSNISRQEIPA